VAAPAETLGTADRTLFHRLREVRLAIAQAQQVPAYLVFPDGVLADMARVRPTSPGELLGISGVGAVKLERYGEAFLEAIRTNG
jgi:ATP-dependent DNA helicase RecQ